MQITEIKLAKPAHRALAGAGINNLEDLSKLTEAELMQLHGIGNNALQTLKQVLEVNGLSFTSYPHEAATSL
nr:DNA-directed RNA polymerase subunit alpha C-terminal domain-containing protein [uncultured Mucilaginibacter sp.]